ncbi:MAG: hypothetical protein WA655_04840 [Candidatus Korobacteraceae bacterium]
MKRQGTMQAQQLEKFARFLDEHPGFAPLLAGEDARVYGFQVGCSYLGIDAMEELMSIQPHFDAREAALLLAPLGGAVRALPSGTGK